MEELPFKTWPYEEQTKMKHMVFEDYIDKWMKIVGKYNKLNYIDGFGGIGAYRDTDSSLYFGSPVLAAETAQKVTTKLGQRVNIIVIDEDASNLENIRKIFEYRKIGLDPVLINADFDETINTILDRVENLAPTFVFVDPFGFSIRKRTIERIMTIRKSEVLLNFMFTRINQFLAAPKIERVLDELFGSTEWQQFKSLKRAQRERSVIEFYRQELKKFSRFVYYYRFEFPKARKTYYYLFHLTNHFKGCVIMKSSFAKFNLGNVEYRGKRADQLGLFDIGETKIDQAGNYLKSVYKGQQKSFQQIIEDQIDETEFLESHLRSALQKLEKEEELRISRIPERTKTGKPRTGISYDDIVIFRHK